MKHKTFLVKNLRIIDIDKRQNGLKQKIGIARKVYQIRKSKLFFTEYYFKQLRETHPKNFQPEYHYLLYGGWENLNPNPLFDSSWYLNEYKDVYLSGMNPLYHYLLYGWKEDRNPHPEFSTKGYLNANVDVKNSGLNPLYHYLAHGVFEK